MPATSGLTTAYKSTNLLDGLIPAGTLVPWPSGAAVPAGYIEALGQIVNRADYPGIFAAYSTTWNTGGESGTQFRLPFGQGRAYAGAGTYYDPTLGYTTRSTGQYMGEASHTLSTGELASHAHSITDVPHGHSYPSYQWFVYDHGSLTARTGLDNVDGLRTLIYDTISASYTGINGTNANGGGAAHNNMQPTLIGRWIIKT